ncbi:unnamed protein product [Porites lobata]|uniref:Uncharacterized protein n=1 Tax=Porites lobata TaxID=104759 RepID=A0ABN8NF57_9CNID|nr:unnamed protein product [Porites lobata]
MEDYKAALNHTFHSALPLHDFCKLFVIPLPGGWPTWYYTKKIIAQLPEPSSQEHPYFSLIPEEGPFHLCLNINEDKVQISHSLLPNHISTHYSGDEIHDSAISLAASDTARKFHSSFVRPYTRGYRQPFQSSRNKRPKFHPQTFNEIIDTKSLPLSYK